MNARMLKTEIYKICLKKVIWISLVAFLALFLALKFQMLETVGVKYTLEPMRSELTGAVENEDFHDFVRSTNYSCSYDDLKQYVPETVFDFIEQYESNDRVHSSLNRDLVSTINNYYERIDNRTAYISELAEDVATSDGSGLSKVKAKLLQVYQNTQVDIELNLESSANNFIDVNHSVVFPGLITLSY